MKFYLSVLTMMFVVGLTGFVPATVLAVDAPAANSVIETIHLNQASAEELQSLPGVGPALSERIVIYRDEHGPFKSVDQLTEVKGIGQAKLAKFKSRLKVD
jgi:competence protein ComEA